MLIEVEKDQYDALVNERNRYKQSADLVDAVGANPKTRAKQFQLWKEVKPDLVIPEIDAAKPIQDDIASLRAELDADRKARTDAEEKARKEDTDRSAKSQIEKGRGWLRSKGYQDDGIEQVEKLMQDRGIPDYEAAALLFERTQPKDELITPSNMGRSWGLFDPPAEDNDIRRALSMPKGAAQTRATMNWQWKEIDKALKESRQGARQ